MAAKKAAPRERVGGREAGERVRVVGVGWGGRSRREGGVEALRERRALMVCWGGVGGVR